MSSSSLSGLSERLRHRRERLLREAVEAAARLLEALEKRGVRVDAAYLFGSRVRGDALETSDVDLVVVSESFQDMTMLERLELVYRVEWEERVKPWIEVVPLTPEELREKLGSHTMLRDASRYWIPLHPKKGAQGEE